MRAAAKEQDSQPSWSPTVGRHVRQINGLFMYRGRESYKEIQRGITPVTLCKNLRGAQVLAGNFLIRPQFVAVAARGWSFMGEVAVHETSISGLLLVDLADVDALGRPMADERGSFSEAWQIEKMSALGLPRFVPVQLSVSRNRRGAIRGIHGEPWAKYIQVVSGSVYAAIVDLRRDSSTFGKWEGFTLGATNALYLPEGMGNSFQALDEVIYTYLVTGLYDAARAANGEYPAVNFADPELAISWPIGPAEQIVSEKDRHNPTLAEAFPRSG